MNKIEFERSEYWVKEILPYQNYTLYKSRHLESVVKVNIRYEDYGPFESTQQAVDWIAENEMPHASYEINRVSRRIGR